MKDDQVTYLTDGSSLYEVVSEYLVRNYGLAGSFLRGATVQDCLSGDTMVLPASRLLTFRVVEMEPVDTSARAASDQ